MKDEEGKGKVLLLGGPTATGKSTTAIWLAENLPGEVINADSLLFYRHLDIGTAKPSIQDRNRVPHHLIDILDPDQEFDAYRYAQTASQVIQEVWSREKLPIVVGGTGFYMKALMEGLPPLVDKDPLLRKRLLEEEEARPGTLHARLIEVDPEVAKVIHPRDKVRVIRALEIFHLTGRPPHQVWREKSPPLKASFLKIALHLPREELYARIDARAVEMVKKGLLEEIQRILNMGYPPTIKPLQAIGYKEATLYLQGLLSKEEMIKEIQRKTRNYAKRQITWFKKEGFIWLPPQPQKILEKVEDWIEEQPQWW